MNIDLNKVFFAMMKEKEFENDPRKFELNNFFDFNYFDIFQCVYTESAMVSNTMAQGEILYESCINNTNHDLVIKVAFKKFDNEYVYQSYYPYSMQQVSFLYQLGVKMNYLTRIYYFTEEEIKKGYASKEGLKEEFYPLSIEFDKKGMYYFNKTITGLPEFIDFNFIKILRQ
jgi:hypothetical protein